MSIASKAAIGLCGVLAVGSAYAEHSYFQSKADYSVGMVDPKAVALNETPIFKDWVLEGTPDTRSRQIAQTNDGSTEVYVWQTTASRFNWFYDFDEVVTVIEGEMFLTDGANAPKGKPERRLGPGDVVFFPAGSSATWRVPDRVRKIATLRHPLPSPLASVMRWGKAIKGFLQPNTAVASL